MKIVRFCRLKFSDGNRRPKTKRLVVKEIAAAKIDPAVIHLQGCYVATARYGERTWKHRLHWGIGMQLVQIDRHTVNHAVRGL